MFQHQCIYSSNSFKANHVDGKYEATAKNPELEMIEVTYGYSRDHRPDLKQFVMNLICVGDGDIPVLMEIASGNQSDKARFAGLLDEFKQQWTFEGLCIADGALYSAENINAMNDLQWLTRVPLSIKEASTLVNEKVELKPSTVKGYKLRESSSEYGGVPQRWLLIESEQRRKSDLTRLAKKIEQHEQKSSQALKKLSAQEFARRCRCHQSSTKIVEEIDMASTLRYSDG